MAVIVGGALAALAASANNRIANFIGSAGCAAGCALGLYAAVDALFSGEAPSFHAPWSVPYGSLSFSMDPLSAFFLIPLFGLCMAAAVYGAGYMAHHADRRLGPPWFFYNILVAAMAIVVTAGNGVLFLVAWEVMSISSFILVMFDHSQASTRRAGLIYIVAAHLGVAFLFAMFILLGGEAGSLDFDTFKGAASPAAAGVIFTLALIGFGSKAGFMPFHVWLPEAHPAAPSHVSAVMSGVMIKMGVYGLLRVIYFLDQPQWWWGAALIFIGVVSGVMGAMLALGENDMKRLLAYSSVENMGIIAAAMGLGTLGMATHTHTVAALGFGGALYHVINHSVFKGLLFMGAGTVLANTHTQNISLLGGIMKKAPLTGLFFAVGSVAICGLPPLNGFMGELLVYMAAFTGIKEVSNKILMAGGVVTLAGLAMIGGLAVAVFTKAFGMAFLGEARSEKAAMAHDPGRLMTWPMGALAAMTLVLGLGAPLTPHLLAAPAGLVAGFDPSHVKEAFDSMALPLYGAAIVSAALALFLFIAWAVRQSALKGKQIRRAVTWDCGYAAPKATMQYTPSSFAQPFTGYFRAILRPVSKLEIPDGYFPAKGSFTGWIVDVCDKYVFAGLFSAVGWTIAKLQKVKTFRANVYIFYTTGAIIALFAITFGFTR